MNDRHHPDPAEAELTEEDLAIATLVGRYIERRETGRPPCAPDLFAVAAEFGDTAVDALRTVLACYEAMRASHDLTPWPEQRRTPTTNTRPRWNHAPTLPRGAQLERIRDAADEGRLPPAAINALVLAGYSELLDGSDAEP